MPDIPIPAINECAIAFDLDDRRFIFISSGVSSTLGYTADDFYENTDLLSEMVHPDDKLSVQLATDNITEGSFVEITYRINTSSGIVKTVFEKRDLIMNRDNGHKILFSLIKEQPGVAATASKKTASDKLSKSGLAGEIKKTTKKLDTFIESVTDAFFSA